MTSPIKVLLLMLLFRSPLDVNGSMIGNNPHHRQETLQSGKYQLEWFVDWNLKQITFNVTAQTNGYVGFGLSRDGEMVGADIVVGGVYPNGTSYFSDRYSDDYEVPKLDPSQDYVLHFATENGTHTCLSFSRKLDTGDTNDHPITNDGHLVIWAFGDQDEETLHEESNCGAYNVALLQPDYSPEIEIDSATGNVLVNGQVDPKLHMWTIRRAMMVPPSDTTYWCTIHKLPTFSGKHHLIGFNLRYATEESQQHVHHVQINKCHAPQGTNGNTFFTPFLEHPGQSCYKADTTSGPIPTDHCQEMLIGSAFAGRMFFFPPHVGIPIGDNSDEFYTVQVHYDNPTVRSDLFVSLTVEFYHTENRRTNDAGFMAIGHMFPGTPVSILLPPFSTDHAIRGHCSPECTRGILPKEGINIYAILLHSHGSGRKMRLEHFRNNKALTDIARDDNYIYTYQQFHVLQKEVNILPGDHLVTTCEFDNSLENDTRVGGFSSSQEMCVTMTLYYNKIPDYSICASEIESDEKRLHFLGVKSVTWRDCGTEFVVETPESLKGKTISQVSNSINWSGELREELKIFHLTYPHNSICLAHKEQSNPCEADCMPLQGPVAYPKDEGN